MYAIKQLSCMNMCMHLYLYMHMYIYMCMYMYMYISIWCIHVLQRLLDNCRDLLSNWLDDVKGSSVTDKAIFADLARYYEADYHDDMQSLNVSRAML